MPTILFASFGALLLVIGAALGISRRRFIARAVRVPGVVVGSQERRHGTGASRRAAHHAIVRFEHAGRSRDAIGTVPHRHPLSLGAEVGVFVDPARPDGGVLLDQRAELWSGTIMLLVLGMLGSAAAAIAALVT